ncbi:MAG: response regulator [Selenomonadaceae bacterium]|nr:response regulator [Selenomonadaceae bacterium]
MDLKEWQILKKGRRSDFMIIAAITAIFLLVMAMNLHLLFQMTSSQAEETGRSKLETIRSSFQRSLRTAEGTTMQLAKETEELLKANAPLKDVEDFFNRSKREQNRLTDGVCFNVYMANDNWSIIPDFDTPPEYHATERIWYKDALKNPGRVHITEPYIDALTGVMCYTMSKALPDNKTVVGTDFNLLEIQNLIHEMSATRDHEALIVTPNGMIIGCSDMSLVGENISEKLPDCEEILNRIVQSGDHESFTAQIDGDTHTIFSSATNNGWYMIVSVNNWELYKNSYRQMIFSALLNLLMMSVIIFFYLRAMRNALRSETMLKAKDEFLSRLSQELKAPLRNILDLSSTQTLESNANPIECAAQVRESALRLSDMLENLFSFSKIISKDEIDMSVERKLQDAELAKVSRYARVGIISVLIVAMTLAFGICFTTVKSWGDTEMHREVENYDNQLYNWIANQRAILSMFVNLLREHPELMDDYPSAVKFLDDLAKHYPEISVCYLANPYKEHSVIMNNGWQPPDEFKPETRPWYIATEHSVAGFSISAPYYDVQTGLYCITMAQIVFSDKNEFIGIFAIDFYIDSLIYVLGTSYTQNSYAFLVDSNGIIINHPNADYQLSNSRATNIGGTEYAEGYGGTGVRIFRDYTNNFVACTTKKNAVSDFTVVVANSWWNIYGNMILLGVIFLVLLGVCTVIVRVLINRLLRWQETVNVQMKAASDTAVAVSQSKSQFLAQMSHEIRTPINAILGMNEMILRESKSDDILDYATNIRSAGRTLLTLINSILDFSKIEDGKMDIVPVRYETRSLINDLVNMTVERAKKKGLDFKTEISPSLPKSLYGDDVRLRQVIMNLLTNAVKYTPEGSVTLKMEAREIDIDTCELQIAVSDTGIGIRAEDMDKLFLSFRRLDEERNRNIEGTGLGITIVQKLLGMMKSNLEVASEYGHGSKFSFKLIQKIIDRTPMGDYDIHRLKSADDNAKKRYLTAPNAKVLAVDDNDMNLKVIAGLLKRNKIVPDLVESGQLGIELAKKNFYHVIFLDNMMPGLSGVETLKIMQREKILSDKTAVVMLTASAMAGMREMYLREGFHDYLSKPIEVKELESILERYLPAEIVSFEVEGQEKPIAPEETEEVVDEDEFGTSERKRFAEICPDINLETGLNYCMDSKSFFNQMLMMYADAERAEKIQEAFDAGDVKTYQILVHALKSTSMSIGAEAFGERARKLELAAKNNNLDEIRAGHADLMAAYQKLCREISEWLEVGT